MELQANVIPDSSPIDAAISKHVLGSRNAKVRVFVAHESAEVSAELVAAIRSQATCDVAIWTGQCAEQEYASDVVHAIDLIQRTMFHGGGVGATSAPLILIAPSTATSNPSALNDARPRSARGGLAPSVRRQVCQHIEQVIATRFPLSDLAAIARLSEFHFARAFKQSLGVPPHRYLIQRRIARAAEIIKTTDKPLSEVALDVGFSDQSHFTRLFVRITGETPRAFRHRHR